MKKLLAIALTVLMVFGLATVAFAENSATGDTQHIVKVVLNLNGNEKFYSEQTIKHGESVTITAPKEDGFKFIRMTIEGDFTEAKRDLKEYTTESVTITPNGDILVTIYYEKVGAPNPSDDGPTSPATGVNYTFVALAVILGIFGAAVATKKMLEK